MIGITCSGKSTPEEERKMRLTESQLRKIVRQEIMREGLPS